jgi:hypothetical protein
MQASKVISDEHQNADGTRKDVKLAIDYAKMGGAIKIINEVIAGSRGSGVNNLASDRQARVDRNVAHLEQMKALDDWGSEDMTAVTNAITAGKGYTAS